MRDRLLQNNLKMKRFENLKRKENYMVVEDTEQQEACSVKLEATGRGSVE
jgi:hypothetical protein